MKIAVIGSRGLEVPNLEKYLPVETTEIVSGGARGVDFSARKCAVELGLKLTEFLPEYSKYGKIAPIKRNIQIIEHSDTVFAFWDGVSKGTKHVIDNCKVRNIPLRIFMKKTVTQEAKGSTESDDC